MRSASPPRSTAWRTRSASRREPLLRTVLVTGFDPFGGAERNASWEAVRRLDGALVEGRVVAARRLPTELVRGPAELIGWVRSLDPELVLCVGQAAGRSAISLERCFHNRIDATIPDNAGARPLGVEILADGPPTYAPDAPVGAMLDELLVRGLPVELSDDAGRYVCNATAYRLAHALEGTGVGHAFVHVPALPSPTGPGMATEDVARALLYLLGRWLRSAA